MFLFRVYAENSRGDVAPVSGQKTSEKTYRPATRKDAKKLDKKKYKYTLNPDGTITKKRKKEYIRDRYYDKRYKYRGGGGGGGGGGAIGAVGALPPGMGQSLREALSNLSSGGSGGSSDSKGKGKGKGKGSKGLKKKGSTGRKGASKKGSTGRKKGASSSKRGSTGSLKYTPSSVNPQKIKGKLFNNERLKANK